MARKTSPDDLKIFRNALYAKLDIERARAIAENILFNDEYLHNLKRRALAGILPPAMEMMLWHYVFGKPQDVININVNHKAQDLALLSNEELAIRAQDLSTKLKTSSVKTSEHPPVDIKPESIN